jgi:hypothetical protein
LLLVDAGSVSRRRRAIEGLCGVVVAVFATALLLAVRGELHPYLDTIAYNVHYSDAGVGGGGIRAHVDVVHDFFAGSGKWQLPGASIATLSLIVVTLGGWTRLGPVFRRLSAVALATMAAAFVTLAMTAIFTVHLQFLAYPISLACATFVMAFRRLVKPLGVVAAMACMGLAARASLGQLDLSGLSVHTWTRTPVSTPGAALESTRARLFPSDPHVAYAVFGRNTEDGHAAFVASSMDLRCRYFHQYPFYRDAQLRETIDCARRERPELILVTTSFYDPMPGYPAWQSFVAETRQLLRGRYELVTQRGMSEVWRLRHAPGATS